ncbi:MAG: HEAT repeat domain-containing protein [Candidatus Heimdallarchaeaceae archaeon]
MGKLSKLEKYFSTIDWSCILNKINKQLYIWPYYSSFLELLSEIVDNRRSDYFAKDYKKEKVIKITSKVLSTSADEELILSLVKALHDQDPDVRAAIVEILGIIGDQQAVEPLIKLLKDDDSFVRRSVAELLGNLGDSRAVKPLIPLLKDEFDHVRLYVAEALGKIGDPRAVDALVHTTLYEKNFNVYNNAITSLIIIGDSSATEKLIELGLYDKDPEVRSKATAVLGEISNPKFDITTIYPDLEEKYGKEGESDSSDFGVRCEDSTAERLAELTIYDEDKEMRERALNLLVEIFDSRAIDKFVDIVLYDEDSEIRKRAGKALGKIGNVRACEKIMEHVISTDDKIEIRNAREALRIIGFGEFIEEFEFLLLDRNR